VAAGDVVHWDWLLERPIDRRTTFDRAQYLDEVRRFEMDHSWETLERTAVRLIVPHAFSRLERERRLRFAFAGNDHRDGRRFRVVFTFDERYQVFAVFDWDGRGPEELVNAIGQALTRPPSEWNAEWHGITAEARTQPPPFAGPNWSKYALR
jgi:hypothetical protein